MMRDAKKNWGEKGKKLTQKYKLNMKIVTQRDKKEKKKVHKNLGLGEDNIWNSKGKRETSETRWNKLKGKNKYKWKIQTTKPKPWTSSRLTPRET